MSKKIVEVPEPEEVKLVVRIEPAFRLVIEEDSTGKQWSGHSWYGDTGIDVLRRMRNSLRKGTYRSAELRVKSSTPRLVAAVSWKEEVIDPRA